MTVFKSPPNLYTIELPGPFDDGRTYTIASPDYEAGKQLMEYQQRAQLGALALAAAEELSDATVDRVADMMHLDDTEEVDFYRLALGDVLDDMLADRCPFPYVTLCAGTVVRWVTGDVDAARRYFESGGRLPAPKARKQPQDRKPRKR